MSFFQLFQNCLGSGLGTFGDFSSGLLLHDPQSVTKLLIHYPQMSLFNRIKQSAPLPFLPIKDRVSVTGIVDSDTTLLGGGGGGKASFSPFEVGKTSQRPSFYRRLKS